MKFEAILVPMDGSIGSKGALSSAISLAKKTDGLITAVYVIPFPAFQMYIPNKIIKEKLYIEAKKFLESAKKSAEKEGVKLRYEILQGHVGDAITDYAKSKKHKIDLIVIGSRGLGSIREMFLGSVTNYVMHKSKVPVLVIK